MWKDVEGRVATRKLKGASGKVYGNMKLYSQEETNNILADGIIEVIPEPPPPVDPADELEKAKLRKKRYLEEAYAYMSQVGVEVDWGGSDGVIVYDTDPASLALMNSAITSLLTNWTPDTEFYWKGKSKTDPKDKKRKKLSENELKQIALAMSTHVETQWLTMDALKAQVDAATTVEEIDGIWWPWPGGVDPRTPGVV